MTPRIVGRTLLAGRASDGQTTPCVTRDQRGPFHGHRDLLDVDHVRYVVAPATSGGWYKQGEGPRAADRMRKRVSAILLRESSVVLDPDQRRVVERTVADHCAVRGWTLHGVNCRTNHVHVAVTAPNRSIELPHEQFKAWCTRKLESQGRTTDPGAPARENWWTDRGWDEYLDDEPSLAEVIAYISERQ